jgi:hypothetical protein
MVGVGLGVQVEITVGDGVLVGTTITLASVGAGNGL